MYDVLHSSSHEQVVMQLNFSELPDGGTMSVSACKMWLAHKQAVIKFDKSNKFLFFSLQALSALKPCMLSARLSSTCTSRPLPVAAQAEI